MGKELMSGVTNEVPRIEPYGDAVVTVESSLKLFQLLRLLADLGTHPTDRIDYRVAAKIDFAGLIPTQRVEQTGEIDLSGAARREARGPHSLQALGRGGWVSDAATAPG
jgi:hypothetical protein